MNGTILIPGPQGQPSTCLANMSANNNDTETTLPLTQIGTSAFYAITLSNFVGVGITSTSDLTFTFNLSGNYLFQYNLNTTPTIICKIQLLLNSVTPFGIQPIGNIFGSYGCSVIYSVIAGNTVNLTIDDPDANVSFASLTIIKL